DARGCVYMLKPLWGPECPRLRGRETGLAERVAPRILRRASALDLPLHLRQRSAHRASVRGMGQPLAPEPVASRLERRTRAPLGNAWPHPSRLVRPLASAHGIDPVPRRSPLAHGPAGARTGTVLRTGHGDL